MPVLKSDVQSFFPPSCCNNFFCLRKYTRDEQRERPRDRERERVSSTMSRINPISTSGACHIAMAIPIFSGSSFLRLIFRIL